MGYYTEYNLEVINGETHLDDYKDQIGRSTDYESSHIFESECKWYTHEEDMKAYSKKHPKVIFALSGIGEEQPDMWCKYFKDGKMQKAEARITYDEYDETKLE